MRGILFWILAVFFPWSIFLLEEKVGLAFLAMALQVTVIGWLPMSILAVSHRGELSYFKKKQKFEKKSKKANSDKAE